MNSSIPVLSNFALNKTAVSSSTYTAGDAWRAVDGNRSPLRTKDWSCAHTYGAIQPWEAWWYVDLGEERPVMKVEIVARAEASGELTKFEITMMHNDL